MAFYFRMTRINSLVFHNFGNVVEHVNMMRWWNHDLQKLLVCSKDTLGYRQKKQLI